MPRNPEEYANGRRYGRLLILESFVRTQQRHVKCRCDCGTETSVRFDHVRTGRVASCGCLRNEKSAARLTTHGDSATSLHSVWRGMVQRCSNPKAKRYLRYGGR